MPARSLETIKVDPKLKAAWSKSLAAINAAIARDASAFDERWELAAKVVEHSPPLYVFGGHKSAPEFFEKVLRERPRNAWRFIRVAKIASPKEEAKYGVSLIDAALSYVEAKSGAPLPNKLPTPLDRLKVEVTRGKTTRAIPLADATVLEVVASTKRLLEASGKLKKPTRGHAERALSSIFEEWSPLENVKVRERAGYVSIERIPLAAWAAFKDAINKARFELLVRAAEASKPAKSAVKKDAKSPRAAKRSTKKR
jgi:hypothetical protein